MCSAGSRCLRGLNARVCLAQRVAIEEGVVMADLNKVFLMGRLTFDPHCDAPRWQAVTDSVWPRLGRGRAVTASAVRKHCLST